jgi:hypothetical protein
MDYMKESGQVAITQIATAYVFCLIVGGLSILNAFLHANSPLTLAESGIAAVAAIAGIVYCTRKIADSLKTEPNN